ncbi:MAG: tetratricopeptide repeat protein [Planctomycetota bacterium]
MIQADVNAAGVIHQIVGDTGFDSLYKLQIPPRIGNYQIIRWVGEGGMGIVYEAEQDHPHRRVALKVLRAGQTAGATLIRFHREVEILGQLEHPGIARIYDAGTYNSAAGVQPFIAMEFVEGTTVTTYCKYSKVSIRERMELFVTICDAVEYAHSKNIIHRDLKPGNILITSEKQPKILDFGIARRLGALGASDTNITNTGQLLGTLAYMSPEQLDSKDSHGDRRGDVYALGVILYEILAEMLPYDLSDLSITKIAEKIRNTDPIPLAAVNPLFRGDVETIVNKALEKEPERRYARASDFAADIRNYLLNLPISARPATAIYRLQKFTRRYRAVVAAIASGFLLLIIGFAVALWGWYSASAANLAYLSESKSREAIYEHLDRMLQSANPWKAGRNTKVIDVLIEAEQDIESRFKDSPNIERGIRLSIGKTYASLGEYTKAESNLNRALELADASRSGKIDRSLILSQRAFIARTRGRAEDALRMLVEALAIHDEIFGKDALGSSQIHEELASVYQDLGTPDASERAMAEATRILLLHKPSNSREAAIHYLNAADVYRSAGQYNKSSECLDLAEPILKEHSGERHASTLHLTTQRAELLLVTGKSRSALDLLTPLIPLAREVYGNEHPSFASLLRFLGIVSLDLKDLPGAKAYYLESLQIAERVYEPGDRMIGSILASLAELYFRERDFEQSLTTAERSLAILKSPGRIDHVQLASVLQLIASVNEWKGNLDKAIELTEEALTYLRSSRKPGHVGIASALDSLGMLYHRKKNYEKAIPFLKEALECQLALTGENNSDYGRVNLTLGLCYLARKEMDLAKKHLELARVIIERVQGPDSEDLSTVISHIASYEMLAGNLVESEKYSRQVVEMRTRTLSKNHWLTALSEVRLAEKLMKQEKYEEAEKWAAGRYKTIEKEMSITHPYTQAAVKAELAIYEKLGKKAEADELRKLLNK